jgi:hypothetical protein
VIYTALRGIQNVCLLGKESVYGTAVATTKYLGLMQSLGGSIDQNVGEHFGLGQSNSAAITGGLLTYKRNFELLPTNGRFLEYFVFGGTTTHVDTSSDCTHTFVYTRDIPSFTVEESYENGTPDVQNVWKGFLTESCTLNLSVDAELTASISGSCKDLDASGTTASAFAAQDQIPIRGIFGSLNIGGAISEVQSFSLTLSRNSTTMPAMGQRIPAAGGSHTFSVEFSAKVGYNSNQFDAKITGAAAGGTATQPTADSITFSADNGVVLGSGKRAFSMALTNCQYSSVRRDTPLSDFVYYDITGKGKLSTTTFVDSILQASW